MSSVIEEILTSSIGFVIAMVILTAVIAGGLYGYWVYANHVTLENYLWPIAEVLPYKGNYFLAIVNTGNEPFYVEQIYLKGGAVLTPSQAANPGLSWCSTSNTKLMHNQWWCGMVNKLPVAVRICSTLDPSVCVVAPVHGWSVVTFSQPSQAAFGISNCPVLASVSDSQGAGWEVVWSMAGNSYSVSKSTSYQWCILPPYYPITINFQSTITSNPSNYQCQISPQSTQVNYNGTPTTVPFTVTCQQSQSSPPGGGGNGGGGGGGGGGGNNNNNYFVYVTVTGDSYGAGWEVSSGDYDITGTGNVNNEKLAIIGPGITIRAWITSNPSGYTCSISPSSYSNVQNGSTYTFTVSCQPITTSGPYCIVNPSASDNIGGGSGAYVSPSGTQYIPPGQSLTFSWVIQNNPVGDYYFNNWVVTLNGNTVVNEQYTSVSYTFTCPSTLSSNQTYTLSGTAYYWQRYLQVGGGTTFNVNGNGTYPINSQYTTAYFTWSDPLFQSGSWNIQYQAFGTSFTISVQLNDYYSESGQAPQLQASTTLNIQGPTGYTCWIDGISPTQGSINSAQASNWLPTSAQVSIGCASQSSNPGPPL
jgi:hypothetical protein